MCINTALCCIGVDDYNSIFTLCRKIHYTDISGLIEVVWICGGPNDPIFGYYKMFHDDKKATSFIVLLISC